MPFGRLAVGNGRNDIVGCGEGGSALELHNVVLLCTLSP
jgi:hypothetical protein